MAEAALIGLASGVIGGAIGNGLSMTTTVLTDEVTDAVALGVITGGVGGATTASIIKVAQNIINKGKIEISDLNEICPCE